MASFLRPRRGKKATAISQGLILKRGEFFVEVPDTGVGTGVGKIKMGDGSTSYTNLPYLVSTEDDKIGFTDTSAATDPSNNPTYLTNIAPGNNLKTVFTNLKQLVYNHNSQLAELNNDLTATVGVTDVPFKFEYDSASGKYGYRDGADTFCPFNDGSSGGDIVIDGYDTFNGTYNSTTTVTTTKDYKIVFIQAGRSRTSNGSYGSCNGGTCILSGSIPLYDDSQNRSYLYINVPKGSIISMTGNFCYIQAYGFY